MSTSPTSQPSVPRRAALSLMYHKEALAHAVTDALYAEMPELMEKYGERGRRKCLQDMRYNLDHLAPAVDLENPEMFAGYTLWLDGLLAARNVSTAEVVRCLALTQQMVGERMAPEEAAEVSRSIRAGLAALQRAGA